MGNKISSEDNFTYLFVALIFLLFSIAAVEQFADGAGQRLVSAATVVSLLVSVWSVRERKTWFRAGLGYALLLLAIVVTGVLFNRKELDVINLFVLLTFYITTTLVAARQVLFTGKITTNKIIGAICIFFLLGLIWAICYLLLMEVNPASFNNLEYQRWHDNFSHIVYYSFVTLTTLGYGEITPAVPLTQFFAYLEAVTGLFYIAIIVASLVGVNISSRSLSHKNNH